MELLPFSNIILPVAGNVPNMGFIYGINQIKPGENKESPRKNFLDLGVI